jgi:phospholipid-binding lipoprotein MlaA
LNEITVLTRSTRSSVRNSCAATRSSLEMPFSETVESILYDSADSYAQARLLYLQNRRFELGQGAGGADAKFEDPYADQNFEDPYAE